MKVERTRELGEDTWLVRDISTDTELVLRHYHPAPAAKEALKEELEIDLMLNHPNLLTTLEVGEDSEGIYVLQPYCPNGTCQRYAGTASEQLTQKIEADVTAGMEYLHGRGLSHGKICLNNILCYRGHYVLADRALNALGEHASEADDRQQLARMLYELREGHQPPAGYKVQDHPTPLKKESSEKKEPHPLSTVKDDEKFTAPKFEDHTRDDRMPTKSPRIDLINWLKVVGVGVGIVAVIVGVVMGVRWLNSNHLEAVHEAHVADSLRIEAHEDSINPIPKSIRMSVAYLDTAMVWEVNQVPDSAYRDFVKMFHQGRVTDLKNSPFTPQIKNPTFVDIMRRIQDLDPKEVREVFVNRSRHEQVDLEKIRGDIKWMTR